MPRVGLHKINHQAVRDTTLPFRRFDMRFQPLYVKKPNGIHPFYYILFCIIRKSGSTSADHRVRFLGRHCLQGGGK